MHRLVAEAFIPNIDNKPEVNHKDRNPANNAVSNLEWVTKQENMDHAINNGWDPTQSRLGKKSSESHKQHLREALINRADASKSCRCVETGQIFPSYSEAARVLGLGNTSVSRSIHEHKQIKGMYTIEAI